MGCTDTILMHDFEAEDQGELNLSVGDYVVVRQVSPTGWSEGECKEKAGWFPSLYVERRQHIPARKVADASPGVQSQCFSNLLGLD
ncbi:hypothetical protein BDL97_U03400 [Sphagnum fallax]|nr:hypothetical protein BDL97_U03400 [Sphagnum fallax]